MTNPTGEAGSLTVRLRLRGFSIPPIQDALVLGKEAPIGAEAMCRALKLLHVLRFERLEVNDSTVEAILVRETLLYKIPKEKFVALVLRRVKPFMSKDEVIHLDVEPELFIEEQV
jgi:hypothetical protein